jgi:hypothetical protein
MITDTLDGILQNQNPWIREYFHGPRARAAAAEAAAAAETGAQAPAAADTPPKRASSAGEGGHG